MVGSVALLALALAQPAPELRPGCALVAPNGDAIAFQIVSVASSGNEMLLVGDAGSVWPTRTLAGVSMGPGAGSFAFGGAGGLVVQLGEAQGQVQPISIRRRAGNGAGLPLAYGYCRPEPRRTDYRAPDPSIAESQIGASIPAFDPARWPENDCGLILSDGRRTRFGFSLEPAGSVRLSSPDLWSGRPVTLSMRWGPPRNGPQFGSFERRGGPSGTQVMHIDESRGNGVKLIQLSRLGDSSAADLSGFAICGYRGLVRRPAREG